MQNLSIRSRKPYRDKVAIVAEILEMASGGVQKTSLMYKVGLSSLMLGRYMRLMMNAKLVDVGFLNDKVVLRATERGKEFLLHCQEIIDLLETENNALHRPSRRIQAQAPFVS
ncbi:MAG TPA: winged helix-turn-helix domain-containing protein [Candidatus Acidoferrum sp.]|nr:winged helix-turn-helix domain-containing protein [Candidatus Acidoferrum sp.]